MARDRFIRFEQRVPSRGEVEIAIRSYVEGLADHVYWDRDRFFVMVPGMAARIDVPVRRWFEVYLGPTLIDVMTREMDDVTNAIADGFARLVARTYEGKLEE